jgi:hypothetical protein
MTEGFWTVPKSTPIAQTPGTLDCRINDLVGLTRCAAPWRDAIQAKNQCGVILFRPMKRNIVVRVLE